MAVVTSLQSILGDHIPEGGGNTQCAPDWARDRVFFMGTGADGLGPYLSRGGLTTGTEEIYSVLTPYSGYILSKVGLDTDGNVYLRQTPVAPYSGLAKINGETLALIAGAYGPLASHGAGGFANIKSGSAQFMIETGIGGGALAILQRLNVFSGATLIDGEQWPSGTESFICSGKPASKKGFMLNGPTTSGHVQILTLSSIDIDGAVTFAVEGTVSPTAVDAGWTQIYANGMCVDQTDGHLLVAVQGQSGATQKNYIIKINSTTAAVEWACAVPSNGTTGPAGGGTQMAYSRIKHQKYALLTGSAAGSPPNTVTIIDTSDGTIGSTITDGLAGITVFGAQSYDDTLGAILCSLSFDEQAIDSPELLNDTPEIYSGWFVLYLDQAFGEPAPPEPEEGSDTVIPYDPPIITPPVRQLRLFPRLPFNSYRVTDARTDFPVTFRVSEQADLRVSVDGAELTQSDFTFTGKASSGSWYEGGLLTLDTEVEDCIVRVWADPIPARTSDYEAGEFVKAEANASLEKLWITDRAQHLKQTRDTEIPLTGTVTLDAATGGLHFWLQGPITATRAGSDTIYIAGSSGTVLTGADADALCEIVCPKSGLWFIRTKTGTWSVA